MATRADLFSYLVGQLRTGKTQAELSEALNECVRRANQVNKEATLTLTLKIKPNGDTGQYHISDKINTKLPEFDRAKTIMFGTPEGNLQRDDPSQQTLPGIKAVGGDELPPKKIDNEA